ncbi:unnamed protein product, partial [Ranitomeya imitator]
MAVWRRHPSNIRDLEQFAKEQWSNILAEHYKLNEDNDTKEFDCLEYQDHLDQLGLWVYLDQRETVEKREKLALLVPQDLLDLKGQKERLEIQDCQVLQGHLDHLGLLSLYQRVFFTLYSLIPIEKHGNQGKHRVTKRGPALSYPMFTLVTGIVGRWRA